MDKENKFYSYGCPYCENGGVLDLSKGEDSCLGCGADVDMELNEEQAKAYKKAMDEVGYLVVELPEPRELKYTYLFFENGKWDVTSSDYADDLFKCAYECTRQEAQTDTKFKGRFTWIAKKEVRD